MLTVSQRKAEAEALVKSLYAHTDRLRLDNQSIELKIQELTKKKNDIVTEYERTRDKIRSLEALYDFKPRGRTIYKYNDEMNLYTKVLFNHKGIVQEILTEMNKDNEYTKGKKYYYLTFSENVNGTIHEDVFNPDTLPALSNTLYATMSKNYWRFLTEQARDEAKKKIISEYNAID